MHDEITRQSLPRYHPAILTVIYFPRLISKVKESDATGNKAKQQKNRDNIDSFPGPRDSTGEIGQEA